MTNNVLVESNKTLIIDPGVEIQINGYYYIQVEGAIKANGTERDRIKIYGINEGTNNNWSGINVINNNGSSISYSTITGITSGIDGYCDINNTEIKSNYYAIGKSGGSLKCTIKYCDIEGKVSITESVLLDNKISGEIEIEASNIDGNTISGSSLSTNGSLLINNKISSKKVTSYSDIIRYITFDGCDLSIGVRYRGYSSTYPSAIYATQFNNCTFSRFSSDVNNSNFNNCSAIWTSVSRTDREKFDCTGNYWGDVNTVEIKSKGEGKNLSFITDYYDDFNKSRIDYSNYKETAINNVGCQGEHGRSEGKTTYEIGDIGPAGGLIFYDKGYYFDGWRYLEAAPEDIGRYVFGYYRPDGENNNVVGTATATGSGKYNTERLVKYMDIDGKTYDSLWYDTTSEYAAKKCLDYTYGGKEDWFLPSKDELNLMYENLHKRGLSSFDSSSYWSSSEYSYDLAWCQGFYSGNQNDTFRQHYGYVRAIRAF